jgi:hypothetical protein
MLSQDIIVPTYDTQHDPHIADTYVEWARSSRDNSVHIDNRSHYAVESGANLTRPIDFPSSSGKPGRKSMTGLDKSIPSSAPLQFRVTSSAEFMKSNAHLQYRRNDSKFVLHPAALDLPHH